MHRSIDTNISGVQDVIGWTFRNKALCAEALQMQQRSGIYLSFEDSDHYVSHNKRLELLGDTILDSVLCKKWIQARDANGEQHPH
jgi:ribonuclease-3